MTTRRQELEGAIDAILNAPGYRKLGATWRLDRGEVIAVVNLQKSSYADDFYLNLGIYLKDAGSESRPTEAQCHIRWRPVTHAGGVLPTDVASVQLLLREIGLPWLSALSSRERIAQFLQSNESREFLIHRDVRKWAGLGA